MKRAIIIVLDGVGAGELPDASRFKDEGSDTLGNLARAMGGLNLPNMARLGLGNIRPIEGVPPHSKPMGCFGRMAEKSAGKDTTIGHWEITGLITADPFPTYPDGFPPEVIEPFEKAVGRKVIGNCTASGTEIIKKLGDIHVKTGSLIVYTSADSVFQIAAHESVIPIEEQYRICRVAREMLTAPHAVSRVIARPFTGESGNFRRTDRRRDFSLSPPRKTLLDYAIDAGYPVYGIGKIEDIFAGQGMSWTVHTHDNADGMQQTLKIVQGKDDGILFTNLVDYDMLFGHRNDKAGFSAALEAFDTFLPSLLGALKDGDVLFITADHGCDPTTPGTDHSREYVPLMVYGKGLKQGIDLKIRATFSDLGATIAEMLGIKGELAGTSFSGEIR
ncbi:MAG: phosphopentomutase [bacterium]